MEQMNTPMLKGSVSGVMKPRHLKSSALSAMAQTSTRTALNVSIANPNNRKAPDHGSLCEDCPPRTDEIGRI